MLYGVSFKYSAYPCTPYEFSRVLHWRGIPISWRASAVTSKRPALQINAEWRASRAVHRKPGVPSNLRRLFCIPPVKAASLPEARHFYLAEGTFSLMVDVAARDELTLPVIVSAIPRLLFSVMGREERVPQLRFHGVKKVQRISSVICAMVSNRLHWLNN